LIVTSIRTINIILFIIILLWWIGIIWEIVAYYLPNSFYLLPFLKYNYSIVCHTQSDKLFQIGNFNTLVCSRCFGIYSGALLSITLLLLGFSKSVSTKVLLFISIPLFTDVILSSLSLYSYSRNISLFTGLLLGSIGFIYIHNSLKNFLIKDKGEN